MTLQEPQPFVEVSAVWKSYARTPVLRDVSLALRSGKVHAVVGENGAGKSTLAKIIGGHVPLDRGHIRVGGNAVVLSGQRAALRRGIGTVSQELTLAPSLTVLDNVVLGLPIARFGMPDKRRAIAFYSELVESTGIGADLPADASVAGLSRGNQQKVEILRALAQRVRCLVLDEPTASLNERDSQQILEIIRKLKSDGIAILFVSHDLAEVESVADWITVLRDGVVTLSRDGGDASRREILHAMVGRPVEEAYPARGPRPVQTSVPLLQLNNMRRSRTTGTVTLSLYPGEIVSIVGLAGGEATDMARLISGGVRGRAGEVSVSGRDWQPSSYRVALRHGVALLPESRAEEGLLLDRPLLENLTVEGEKPNWYGFIRRIRREEVVTEDLMRTYGVVGGDPRSAARKLSGGNQQKAMIAKTLYSAPRVLIAVNPSVGVDVASRFAIYEILTQWVRRGNALLMITEDSQEAYWLADRVLVLEGSGGTQLEVDTRQVDFNTFVDAL